MPFLLFHHASGPKDYRVITPLMSYLYSKEGERWWTPVYQRKRGDRGFDAVAPFYVRTWDQRDMSHGLYVPPIYWRWQDPADRRQVFAGYTAGAPVDGNFLQVWKCINILGDAVIIGLAPDGASEAAADLEENLRAL